MALKPGGTRGSLRAVSPGVLNIPEGDLRHRYDATDGDSVIESGSVSEWQDQQATADLTGTATERLASAINGTPAISHDGVDDTLTHSAPPNPPLEMYVVAQWQGTEGSDVSDIEGLIDADGSHAIRSWKGEFQVRSGSRTTASGPSADKDPHIFLLRVASDGGFELYLENTLEVADSGDGRDADTLRTCTQGGDQRYGEWYVGEILVYNDLNSASERDTIFSVLGRKWDITV